MATNILGYGMQKGYSSFGGKKCKCPKKGCQLCSYHAYLQFTLPLIRVVFVVKVSEGDEIEWP